MNIVIFGASGGVGQQLILQALEAGHTVTAFVRNSRNLPNYVGKISVVQGDLLDLPSVEAAVQGQDAVLSTFGPRDRKGDLYTKGIANIIEAMHNQQVQRLVCVTSAAVDDTAQLSFIFSKIVKPLFLKDVYRGMKQLEADVEQSNLDWTIIRPGRFTNGPHRGQYRISDKSIKGGSEISRADVADLLLKEATETAHSHQKLTQVY